MWSVVDRVILQAQLITIVVRPRARWPPILVLAFSACSTTAPGATPVAREAVTSEPVTSEPTASEPTASTTLEPEASARPVVPLPPTKGKIACGDSRCDLPAEVCCVARPDDPLKAPADGESICVPFQSHVFHEQLPQCEPLGDLDIKRISYCDAHDDCADGEVCCHDRWDEAYAFDRCVPLRPNGDSPCMDDERCVADGDRCIRGGDVCRDHRCEVALPSVACADAGQCKRPTPLCCIDAGKARCAAHGDCGSTRMECAGPKDCLPGMACCAYLSGETRCAGGCEWAHVGFACESNADCPTNQPNWPRCVADQPNAAIKRCRPVEGN